MILTINRAINNAVGKKLRSPPDADEDSNVAGKSWGKNKKLT